MEYIALYPAGTANLVAEALRDLLPGFEVLDSDESALVFAITARLRSTDAAPFVKNLFLVSGRAGRRSLDATVASLANQVGALRRPLDASAFRVMCHIDGRLVPCSPQARQKLEGAISTATRLRPEPRGRCQEYWVIGRRDWPVAYLGERLPAGKARPTPAKGSLSPELAALLVSLSRPGPRDVFLDPFAGSGSIVTARLDSPARKVIYNDLDSSARRSGAARMGRHPGLAVLREDGTAMASLQSAEVSVIVTDPPWGEYDEAVSDYPAFASSLAAEFARLLNPRSGRLVLLVSRQREKDMLSSLAEQGFTCDAPIEILVNGHPASVLRACPPKHPRAAHLGSELQLDAI